MPKRSRADTLRGSFTTPGRNWWERIAGISGGVDVKPQYPTPPFYGYPSPPKIVHGGSRAYYMPSADTVTVPPQTAFVSAEGYYATLFHELGHSTGHASRLAREGITDPIMFGSHKYSREELVAEMSAAFLCGRAGIDCEPLIDNSAAYVASWIRVLKGSPKLAVIAAAQAQKAADWILGERSAESSADETVDQAAWRDQRPAPPLVVPAPRSLDGLSGAEAVVSSAA